MTAYEIGSTSHKIFIPSKTKDGIPIPPDRRSKFLRQALERCSDLNGGATIVPNCIGYYRSEDGRDIYEDIMVIETFGKKPFSNEEIALLAKELDQECILIQEADFCKATLISGEDEEIIDLSNTPPRSCT